MKKTKKAMKDTIKVGIGSMAGMAGIGAMAALPGMPAAAAGAAGTAYTGLGLVNIGQLAKTGMSLADDLSSKDKKIKCKYLKRMM